VLEAPTGAEAAAIALLESMIMEDHRRGDYPRVEVLGLGGPWQNLAMVRKWEATNGYNPLRIGIYDRLVAPGEENWNVEHRRFPPSFANYDGALAQELGLTYLVLGQPWIDCRIWQRRRLQTFCFPARRFGSIGSRAHAHARTFWARPMSLLPEPRKPRKISAK